MDRRHELLIAEIASGVAETGRRLGFGRLDPAVERALREVPRHAFVPPAQQAQAYANHPLPIGSGQTISQPYIVAVMSQLLGVGPGARVLELGTGSGYQAAVLAAMGVLVYSIEIVPALAERARATLAALGYDQVQIRTGDGWPGWPEAAPFDGIIVTAAAPGVPEPLAKQLRTSGRLVIPLGAPFEVQQLTVYEKDAEGALKGRTVLPVAFVPVTGRQGCAIDSEDAAPPA
jgi:protein-L-isoaspartate(D-aspartate) O-methyltransferase